MMISYNTKYLHYSSPSGNTQFVLCRKSKPETDAILGQIVLGIALVIIGIATIAIMPEDAGAGVLVTLMGIGVVVGNLKKKKEKSYDIMDRVIKRIFTEEELN